MATLGGSIVEACFRPRSPLDYEFATHTKRKHDDERHYRTDRAGREGAEIDVLGEMGQFMAQRLMETAAKASRPLLPRWSR